MEKWDMRDLIEVKNDWKKLAKELAEKVDRYELALKTIQSESSDVLAKGVCTRALQNSQSQN